jgi:hypothetical protein
MYVPPPKPQPKVGKLQAWIDQHQRHARGPWQDAKIHIYYRWLCSCGEKFIYTEAELASNPAEYVVNSACT